MKKKNKSISINLTTILLGIALIIVAITIIRCFFLKEDKTFSQLATKNPNNYAASNTYDIGKNGLGDVDKDGKVDRIDAELILKYVVKLIDLTKEEQDKADVTGDGKITAEDALAVLKYATIIEPHGLGDVNDDGVIDEEDSNLILKSVVNSVELTREQQIRADVNADETVDNDDSLIILNYIVSIRPHGRGDINDDGIINEIDSQLILNHVIGLETLTKEEQKRADINADRAINVEDSLEILKYSVGVKTDRAMNAHGYGDINNDGKINATDAELALKYVVKLLTPSSEEKNRADIDGDEIITSKDALAILKYTTSNPSNGQTGTPNFQMNGLGDVNNDGAINQEDAELVLKYVTDSLTPSDEEKNRADVDGDGEITASDALLILKYVTNAENQIIKPNGNQNWSKTHQIEFLAEEGTYSINGKEKKPFTKGNTITLSDDTGKKSIEVQYTDKDNNKVTFHSNEYWLDNSVTTVTKGLNVSCGNDVLEQRTKFDGTKYFETTAEGERPNVKLVIKAGEDLESGWKSSTYKIEKVLKSQSTQEELQGTCSESILEDNEGTTFNSYGTHKITITTEDNLGNVGTDTYYLYLNKKEEISQKYDHVKVSYGYSDDSTDLDKMRIELFDEGNEEIDYDDVNVVYLWTDNFVSDSGVYSRYRVHGWDENIADGYNQVEIGDVHYLAINKTELEKYFNTVEAVQNDKLYGNRSLYDGDYIVFGPFEYYYKATFNPNGGSESKPKTITKKYGEVFDTLPTTTREGYTFDGWYTSAIGGTKIEDTTKMPLGDVTYYAHWEIDSHTAHFNANGGSTANPPVITKKTGEQLGNLPTTTREGYTFNGWYTSQNEGIKISNSTTMPADDVTYYAHWEVNSYTAHFDANGGNVANPSTITKNFGEQLGNLPTTTRENYTFKGWYTETTGGTKISNTTTMPAHEVTYYAQWDEQLATMANYTIEKYYQQDDGTYLEVAESEDTESKEGEIETNVTATQEDKTPKQVEGKTYIFDENHPKNILEGKIEDNGSLILKLYFKQQYIVTYKPGTQGNFQEQTISGLDYDEDTPEFKGNIIGTEGYEFIGWNPNPTDKVTKSVEYIAQWAKVQDSGNNNPSGQNPSKNQSGNSQSSKQQSGSDSMTGKSLPYAGNEKIVMRILCGIMIFVMIVCYKKYKKYKNI